MNQNLLQLYRELMKIVIKIFRFTYIPTREPPNAPQKPNRLLQCLHPHKSSLYSINGRKVENLHFHDISCGGFDIPSTNSSKFSNLKKAINILS